MNVRKQNHILPLPLGMAVLFLIIGFLHSLISHGVYAKSNACAYTGPTPPSNIQACNIDGYPFNYELWEQTGIVVYGTYKDVPGNDFKNAHQPEGTTDTISNKGLFKKGYGYVGMDSSGNLKGNGEYRYLGFDVNGAKYENIYFPNDANIANDNLSERRWIYKPWNENLTDSSDLNDSNNYFLIQYLKENLSFTIKNGLKLPNSKASSSNPVDYMYIYQLPDLRTVGSGIMWHKRPNGRIWYQTFNLPSLNNRTMVPVEADIIVLDQQPINRNKYNGQSVIPVRVKVVGTLKDESYYGNISKEFAYYTRKDIDYWTISIGQKGTAEYQEKTNIKAVRNTGTAEFTLEVPVDKINSLNEYLATAKATVHFFKNQSNSGNASEKIKFSGENKDVLSLFTVRNLIEFINLEDLRASIINYQDASLGDINSYTIKITNTESNESTTFKYSVSKVNDDLVERDLHGFIRTYFTKSNVDAKFARNFVVEQTIFTKTGKSDTHTENILVVQYPIGTEIGEKIHINDPDFYVTPDLRVPEYGFDVVGVNISDHTDMSKIDSRVCYLNGNPVDENELLSGNYVFGEGNDGIHQIRCDYTTITGQTATQIEWIQIWDTKPKAQFVISGSFKENRKMTITNTSEEANNDFVLQHFPITSYEWEITTIEGEQLKFETDTDLKKEFLSTTPGIYGVKITAKNALGRVSDPYYVEFPILEDIEPSVVLHPYDSQITRGDKVRLMYDAASVDGDSIGEQSVKIYYDSDNDGDYDELIEEIDPSNGFSEYTPPYDKIGKYKIVATVEEVFGEETFSDLLDGTEKRIKTVETWFEVDNLQPSSSVYVDIPIVMPEIDVYFMLDRDLGQEKNDYILNNEVTINNSIRNKNILAGVDSWDMHTYTYTTQAQTTKKTGSTYPSPTIEYSSGGYSGTLSLFDVVNNPYWYDDGYYTTRTESRTFTATCSNSVRVEWENGRVKWHSDNNKCPATKSINSDGYSGTIPKVDVKHISSSCSPSQDDPNRTCYEYWEAYYSGTLEKTVTYWESNWVLKDSYTGYYSGTLYKYVRQPYDNSFFRTTSDKYVVYISDSNINELWDLQMVTNQNDVKVILVGQEGMKEQFKHDYFILNNKPIEEIIDEVIEYIAENNPSIPKYYTLINQPFNLYFTHFDDEKDPIILDQVMYIHDPNYFDNSLGLADFASEEYDEEEWKNTEENINEFEKPGMYTVIHRVKDKPSEDPAFEEYSYFSNESQIEIFAHRKPIAKAKLDWDFDPNQNVYKTTWVDLSYDLDHQFSREDKGIVERKIKYKKDTDSTWIYKIPDYLEPGTYTLEYVVKDVEGVWSDPFVLNFTLDEAPSIQFEAKAKAKLERFSLNSIPASEELQLYDVWTRYPYEVSLEVALFQDNVQKTSTKRIAFSESNAEKTGNDIYWDPIDYVIPETLPDGNYELRITAIGQGGMKETKKFEVTVETPINLKITDFPSVMISGQNQKYNIEAETTKYANKTTVKLHMKKGANGLINLTLYSKSLTLTGTQNGWDKEWFTEYIAPYIPSGEYVAEYKATTPNGNIETQTITYQVTTNRPPIAGFTISPSTIYEGDTVQITSKASDPDGDSLTYKYVLTLPNGETKTYTSVNPSFRLTMVGQYTLKQTVTDTHGLSNSTSKKFTVNALTIIGSVSHTENWANLHQKLGNQVYQFYSGERFILQAKITNHPVEYVAVNFEGEQVNGNILRLNKNLSGSNTTWNGSLYHSSMSNVKTRLKNGWVTFTFSVKYKNGTIKTDIVHIQIIGNAYDVLKYYRSR